MTGGRGVRLAAALAPVLAACATASTVCPDGTEVGRRIYSGGAEAEGCRRPDGVRQGPEVRFYESGARMIEGGYADGAQDGVWRYYFNQGTLWRQDRWADGVLLSQEIQPAARALTAAELDALGPTVSGIVKLAAADPRLGRAVRGAGGRPFVDHYAGGRVRVAGRYDADGLRTGVWRTWYPDGRPAREVEYDGGVRQRAFREWHPNGRAKTDGFYLAGERDGRWRRWDETGRLTEDAEAGPATGVMLPP